MNILRFTTILFISIALTHCIRLEVATPDKPINIDMNVKIDHDIRVTVDKQLDEKVKE